MALDNTVTLFERVTQPNAGAIGKYAVSPTLKITVPAYQPVGIYTGDLTITLIENNE